MIFIIYQIYIFKEVMLCTGTENELPLYFDDV